MRWEYACDFVLGPADEHVHRILVLAQFLVLVRTIAAGCPLINERPEMRVSANIYEMNAGRRGIRKFAILARRIVRREEARKQYDQVQSQQKSNCRDRLGLADHICHSTRTRGSTINSIKSASRFPEIMKTVEANTTPTTTWTSRDKEASSKSGPRPGQPVTISTMSEPLRSPATDNPNKEINGFAAAGNA